MTTGDEHQHCYCSTNTIGQPICCKCERIVYHNDVTDNVDLFVAWEKIGHERRIIDQREKEKKDGKSQDPLPGL